MKSVIYIMLSALLVFTSQGFAETRLERFERLQEELAQTKKSLSEVENELTARHSAVIETTVGAVVWGLVGGGLSAFGRGEYETTVSMAGKFILAGDVLVVTPIYGYQFYKMSLNKKQIAELKSIIDNKLKEFQAARQALVELEKN